MNYLTINILFISQYYIKHFNYLLIYKIILLLFKKLLNTIVIKNFYSGYYKIHPTILYYCVIAYLTVLTQLNFFFKFLVIYILNLLIFTLILGSLWALVDFIWGYYWTNDAIELILLLYVIILIYFIHQINKKKKFFYICSYITIFLNLNLLKFNFFFTKHNFINLINNNKFWNFFFFFFFFILSHKFS